MSARAAPSRALIAGAGALPALIAAEQETPPFVAALDGFSPEGLLVDQSFRLEELGTLLEAFRARGIEQVCLLGKVARPVIDPARIDAATAPLMPGLIAAMAQGDDAALRAVIEVIEGAGFKVVGAHALAPRLLPEPGLLEGAVSEANRKDAARGAAIICALGAADIGQACIVKDGQALAVEALPGTDWMIRSLLRESFEARAPDFSDPIGMAADWLTGPAAEKPRSVARRDPALPSGGILYKAPKPGQELRVDMPTIGPETVAAAIEAELEGIVIEAGAVLMIDEERCRALAREGGVFLWVREGALAR
ncbi:MAG: UDP-2,3-diacylglucosamine diphosphatase LpxI [Pseudomonadota bacterium]